LFQYSKFSFLPWIKRIKTLGKYTNCNVLIEQTKPFFKLIYCPAWAVSDVLQ